MSMKRVSKQNPCPVCGRPDWCLVADDQSAAICQRVESDHRVGDKDAGYLHRLTDSRDLPAYHIEHHRPKRPERPQRDWQALAERYREAMTHDGYQHLSDQLGVSVESLRWLHVGWDGSQSLTTWPMRNADGRIVGIRTRAADNEKRSVSGSDGNGLFYVPDLLTADHLLICEGPTDTAALLDCGYGSAIGRPSCRLGNAYTIEIIKRLKPSAVLLIPDRDQAGLTGFADLAAAIANAGCIELNRIGAITPPPGISDAREWAKKSREHLRGRIAGSLDNITKRTEGIS
jgi:phage/plasmid primase-like uncharacterized protein